MGFPFSLHFFKLQNEFLYCLFMNDLTYLLYFLLSKYITTLLSYSLLFLFVWFCFIRCNLFFSLELTAIEDLSTNRITRILTTDFPQYFAIITRIRQEVHAIGPEGGMVSSTVIPQVQAIFPEGALTKKIKVGLQVNSCPKDTTDAGIHSSSPKSGRALLSQEKTVPHNNHRDHVEKTPVQSSPRPKSGFFAEFIRRTWPKLELFSFM